MHWLPWLVHATEVGYDYVGFEYWQSFRERTPGWVDGNDSRDWIREQFRRFTREFGGVQPSGAWAGQFSIICWPITHSVLPQDLQQQFVSSLDLLHGRFTSELLRNPELLGAAIQSVSSDANSRFRQFIKNTELVGLIASALLLQGESLEFEVLEHAALERIVVDLEKRRNAKDLLDRARAKARHTIAMHGVGRGQGRLPGSGVGDSSALLSQLGLEPTLTLRNDSEGRWVGWLRLPDMSAAASMLPAEVRRTLLESRFRVSGDKRSKFRAGGALMYAMPDIELARWPEMGVPLIQFEDADPGTEELLGSRLNIGGSGTWLFRVRDDCDAHFVRGRTVRGEGEYIVVGDPGTLAGLPLLDEEAAFEGAGIGRLWPAALTADELKAVCEKLQLTQSTTVRVRPVGLPSVEWDGEGNIEWLSLQPKAVAVTADCSDGRLQVRNLRFGEEPLSVPITAGKPVYVDLEPLEVGEHHFELAVSCGGDSHAGLLRIVVREPSAGASKRVVPLSLTPSPRSPSLEEFWDGRFSLEMDGPEARLVRIRATLCREGSVTPLIERQLPSLHLPVDATAWRDHVEKHFTANTAVQSRYDEADMCTLTIDAKELGRHQFRMEREAVPLRWVLARNSNEYCVELRDDTGRLETPRVERYAFDTPDVAVELDPTLVQNVRCVGPAGGLYVAEVDGFACSALVPMDVHGLADLTCRPTLKYYNRSSREIVALLERSAMWHSARIPGQLAALYPMWRVFETLEYKLIEIVAGSNWMHAERDFLNQQSARTWEALTAAVATKPLDRALVGALGADGTLVNGTPRERCEHLTTLIRLAMAFSPHSVPKQQLLTLMEFALRLASSPHGAYRWAGGGSEDLISQLLDAPVYLRVARWLVLATDAAAGRTGYGQPRTDWEW